MDYSSAKSMVILKEILSDKVNSVIDACSSPGSKITYLKDISFLSKKRVLCVEKNKDRFVKLKANLKKYGVEFDCILEDFLNIGENFDLVIIDAPCSDIGRINRNPELRFFIDEKYIKEISEVQRKLFKHGLKICEKYLFYSTCSFLVEENEEIVKNSCKKSILKKDNYFFYNKGFLKNYVYPNRNTGFSFIIIEK
jgi:16S rRNA (cytosine967-C5)-methyltransferase